MGTGAYGAVKAALKHSDVFSKCIAIDGIFDLGKICNRALKGKETGIFHREESLKAVFGDLQNFEGSEHDIYALQKIVQKGSII